MKMTPVQSSQINAIGYAPATQTLRIEFKPGSLYEYANVPPDLFEQFRTAPSVGSFFYKNIKPHSDKYPYVRLENNQAHEGTPQPDEASNTPAASSGDGVSGQSPDNAPAPEVSA